MRYLLALALASAALLAALTLFGRNARHAEAPRLLALAYPMSLHGGERAALYGGFAVPAGKHEVGVFACAAGACRRANWRTIDGPQESWGGLSTVSFEDGAEGASIRVQVFDPVLAPAGVAGGVWVVMSVAEQEGVG